MSVRLTAAILIISQTASEDPTSDKGGPILREALDAAGGSNATWDVVEVKIVPDDVLEIQRAITGWTDSEDYANLVITSGGTGFASKDVTPEVCLCLLYDGTWT